MTVRSEVSRIEANVASAYSMAAMKGASLPQTQNIANLANTINTIQSSMDLNDSLCGYKTDLDNIYCYGKCAQNNTPTPSSPSPIVCNNGEIRFNSNRTLPQQAVISKVPDDIDLLQDLYFGGSQFSQGKSGVEAVGEPYAGNVVTSLSISNEDWYDLKVEIDAQIYNQTTGYTEGIPSLASSVFEIFWQDTSTHFNNNICGFYLGYSDNTTKPNQFATATYNNNSAIFSSYSNAEHRCKFSVDLQNKTVSIYDQTTEQQYDYNISVTQTEITEEESNPLRLFIGYAKDSASAAPHMRLYSVKVTKVSTGELLYYGIPAMNYNTTRIGLLDVISGVFDAGSETPTLPWTGVISDPIYNVIGTQETVTDSVGNIATCRNLLNIDVYMGAAIADHQELKSGVIGRIIGIKILDGTEVWTYKDQAQYGNSTFACADWGFDGTTWSYVNPEFLCTHFQFTPTISNTDGTFGVDMTTSELIMTNTSFTTPSDFAQWLAGRYSSGTPVMVIYPLPSYYDIYVPKQTQLIMTPLQANGSLSNLETKYRKVIVENVIDLTGKFQNIKHVDKGAFYGLFAYGTLSGLGQTEYNYQTNITGDIEFTNLESVSINKSFSNAFAGTHITSASFPAFTSFYDTTTDFTTNAPFEYAFAFSRITTLSFGAFQTIPSGKDYCFQRLAYNCTHLTTASFPLLETIFASGCFNSAFSGDRLLTTVNLPSLKFIDGVGVFTSAWSYCTGLQSISFPSLGIPTVVPGSSIPQISIGINTFSSAFNNCTSLTEIHFRADAQAYVEAQSGYSTRWGASNATVYFDL